MTGITAHDCKTPVDMSKFKMSCESILLKSTGNSFEDISQDELETAIEICDVLRKHDVSHYRARTILRYTEIVLSTTMISNRIDDRCYL